MILDITFNAYVNSVVYYRVEGAVGYSVHLACGRLGVRFRADIYLSRITDRDSSTVDRSATVVMSWVLGDNHHKRTLRVTVGVAR